MVGYHCHTDASITAEVLADEVRLSLRGYSYKGDCADFESVVLDEPLDGRRLIDASTDRDIEPCAQSEADSTGGTCS